MKSIETLNLDITTSISFGTEMKINTERTIKYTNIPVPTNAITKVPRYPHHQFAVLADHPVVVSQFPISIIWNIARCPYSNCPIQRTSGKVSSVGEEANRADVARVTTKWRKERITSKCVPYACSPVKRS